MQGTSLLHQILFFDWTNLSDEQEIRVTVDGVIACELSKTILENFKNYLTRNQSLAVLHLVKKMLLSENKEEQKTEVNRLAKKINDTLRQRINKDGIDLVKLENEFSRMITSIEKKLEDKKARRAVAPTKDKDQIIQFNPIAEAKAANPAEAEANKSGKSNEISQKDQAWLNWFAKITPCFLEIPELFQDIQKCTDAISQLKIKKASFHAELKNREQLKTRLSSKYSEFVKFIFQAVNTPNECIQLRSYLDQLRLNYQLDHTQFAKELIQQMSDEQMVLLLQDAINLEVAESVTKFVIFRNTHSFCGALLGGFFIKLASRTINPIIDKQIERMQSLTGSPDETAKYFQNLLDAIKVEFCKCSFSSSLIQLFHLTNTQIQARWQISGLPSLIANLFLRGANPYIIECSHDSLIQFTLIAYAKFLQAAANERAPAIQEMERYLDLQIRKDAQGM